MGLIAGFIDLVSPPVCFACGGRSYDPICPSCDGMIEFIEEPVCRICGKPGMFENRTCPDCRSTRPVYKKARALAVYEFPVRELVIAMKRRSGRRLAEILAPRIYEAYAEEIAAADLITFVPITPGRNGKRGHNQARELAAIMGVLSGKPVTGTLDLAHPKKDQGHLGKKDRAENIKNAFAIRNRSRRLADLIEGRSFILVDDVLTTGGTANACARVLRRAGAESVTVITLARGRGKDSP